VKLPLREEDGWLPRLDDVPTDVARRAKLVWLNYPNNPTGAVADLAFFERAVAWARAHDVVIAHDLAYSEVGYDGYAAPSILEVDGARDVAIEFNSLSKSFNMTGWRIGMAVGNATLIDALRRVKSNLDSGVPQAVQRMAITALDGPAGAIAAHNATYQRRRDRVVEVLRALGLRVEPPRASLYVWARLPEGQRSSAAYAQQLVEATGVVVTPGVSYGDAGEGYIRLSLTLPDARVEEGLRRLAAFARGERVL
jgi:LL-diaminopimelate aminotransferase